MLDSATCGQKLEVVADGCGKATALMRVSHGYRSKKGCTAVELKSTGTHDATIRFDYDKRIEVLNYAQRG